MSDKFTTIAQHWTHFLERDIAPTAPTIQVMKMKRAFAAGAISGLQLTVTALTDQPHAKSIADLNMHIDAIQDLVKRT